MSKTVFFPRWSAWCPPLRIMTPIIEDRDEKIQRNAPNLTGEYVKKCDPWRTFQEKTCSADLKMDRSELTPLVYLNGNRHARRAFAAHRLRFMRVVLRYRGAIAQSKGTCNETSRIHPHPSVASTVRESRTCVHTTTAASCGFSEPALNDIEVAAEEALTNVIKHASRDVPMKHSSYRSVSRRRIL